MRVLLIPVKHGKRFPSDIPVDFLVLACIVYLSFSLVFSFPSSALLLALSIGRLEGSYFPS